MLLVWEIFLRKFFCNISLWIYTFSSKYCFSFTRILVCWVLIFVHLNDYFLLSFIMSSLTYWLFRRMLCNFYIFVDIPNLLLLFFNFVTSCSKNILCIISNLQIFEACFMVYYVVYLREYSMCSWEKYLFCHCWMECLYRCLLGLLI